MRKEESHFRATIHVAVASIPQGARRMLYLACEGVSNWAEAGGVYTARSGELLGVQTAGDGIGRS